MTREEALRRILKAAQEGTEGGNAAQADRMKTIEEACESLNAAAWGKRPSGIVFSDIVGVAADCCYRNMEVEAERLLAASTTIPAGPIPKKELRRLFAAAWIRAGQISFEREYKAIRI